MKSTLRRLADVDQFLIFFLLAVTINQMGHYLASFVPEGWEFVGYLQAAGVDLAIWRSAWWYRRYTGKKQRRWALVGVFLFAAVSTWYNQGYYHLQRQSLRWWEAWLMGAILPGGVALLSYLKGQKDESKFSTTKDHSAKEPAENPQPETRPATVADWREIYRANGRTDWDRESVKAALVEAGLEPPSRRTLYNWLREANA